MTKSVTSLVVGLGRDRGWLPELDTPLCAILAPECEGLEAGKRAITLRHLLTMRAGLDFPEVDFSRELWVGQPADPIRTILHKPLAEAPGTTIAKAGSQEAFRQVDYHFPLLAARRVAAE